jgi:uncharacterized protein (TIGR03032 family)
VSERYSFAPLWRPAFVSRLAAEDRCHLNGLAMRDGQPRYVTVCSRSDIADGWRDRRRDGGCVVDVATGDVLADGLSMPHSPRVRGDTLWLLESGTGWLGSVDVSAHRATESDAFRRTTMCPGYARGLALHGDFAIVGLSKPRENKTFSGLKLQEELALRDAEPRCGLAVIDLPTGDIVHWLWIDGIVAELYDVVALANVRRPMALGFKTDEIRRTISMPPP